VTTGTYHTCALSNGVTSCWGNGLPGGAIKRDLPQPGGGTWKALIETGRNGQCGTSDAPGDPVYCLGTVLSSTNSPTRVAQLDGFRAITLGASPNNYGLFLDATGLLHGLGDNNEYQLGDGTQNGYGTLTAIGTQTYSEISTKHNESYRGDGNFACGIRDTDQKVACWGAASRGQTGASDTSGPTRTPNEVMNLASCTSIATGVEHACAICSNTVYCWGDNRSAQLGASESDEITSVPRMVTLPSSADTPQQLVAGSRFTCVRTENGRTFCWGLSERGALGTGGTSSNLPIAVRASPP
jgi:alpha-tubulin suppressor-like RCC1 family protein